MAVGFDLRAPMLVDASASIRPDHSCCGAVLTKAVRALKASLGHWFFPIAAAQHENGAHSPDAVGRQAIGQHLGRRSAVQASARSGPTPERSASPAIIYFSIGAPTDSRGRFRRDRRPKKRPPLRRPFDPCNCSAIRPRLRRLDPSRRAGRPRSQGRQTRASSSPRWTAPAPWSSSPSTWRWR
jgi:hypothetical protein